MGNHLIQRKKVTERSKTTQHEPCNVHGHSYIYSLSELILLVTNCCKLLHFLILVYCELLHIYLITFSYLQDEEIKSSCCSSQKNGRLICWRKLEFHYIQLYMCLAPQVRWIRYCVECLNHILSIQFYNHHFFSIYVQRNLQEDVENCDNMRNVIMTFNEIYVLDLLFCL